MKQNFRFRMVWNFRVLQAPVRDIIGHQRFGLGVLGMVIPIRSSLKNGVRLKILDIIKIGKSSGWKYWGFHMLLERLDRPQKLRKQVLKVSLVDFSSVSVQVVPCFLRDRLSRWSKHPHFKKRFERSKNYFASRLYYAPNLTKRAS